MRKNLSKSVLYTLMAFGCFNLFLLTSCSDEAEKTTETTTTTTTESAPTVTTTTTTVTEAPKDSLAVKAADGKKMDTSATQKPVDNQVKK